MQVLMHLPLVLVLDLLQGPRALPKAPSLARGRPRLLLLPLPVPDIVSVNVRRVSNDC